MTYQTGMDMADDTAPENQETTETQARAQQIDQWCEKIKTAKSCDKIKDAFKQMREDMKFARGLQWKGQTKLDDDRYVINITQRHLRQREAALYARNPVAVAKRRNTLDFQLWDGNPASLANAQQQMMQAQQMMQVAQQTGDLATLEQAMQIAQQAQALIQDYQQGTQRRQMLDRMSKTLEIVWRHQIGEQQPPFKKRMKHLVRRVLTTGVGYAKLGYHRFNEYNAEDVARVTDLSEQVAALESDLAQMEEGAPGYEEGSARLAELEDLMQSVTGEQTAYIREGLDFDFPAATSIIPDPDCVNLDGFIGARWIAQEWLLTPDQVRDVYGKDISAASYTEYDTEGNELSKQEYDDDDGENRRATKARIYEVWDKHTRQTFTVCEGYSEFLREPAAPQIQLERFWPFFTLMFNGLEDEEHLFPPSDVFLIRHPQVEMNISRQRLREHRDAARPGYVTPRGKLDESDKNRLATREAHSITELNGMSESDDVRRLLQPLPTNPIDPNLYEVNSLQDDTYKAVGTQEAVMGGSSGVSATESSIAESARLSAVGSAVDELDDFLTELAKSASHLMLVEMAPETVQEIAGRGAVWPDLSAEEVAKDLWLEIRAGSSGRPNKSAELQNLERVMPFLLQIPGIRPDKLAEEVLNRLDDRLDIADFYEMGMPSIVAGNANAQPATGDAESDPNQQNLQGRDQTAVEQGDSNMGPRPTPEARNMDPNRAQPG